MPSLGQTMLQVVEECDNLDPAQLWLTLLAGVFSMALRTQTDPAQVLGVMSEALDDFEWDEIKSAVVLGSLEAAAGPPE